MPYKDPEIDKIRRKERYLRYRKDPIFRERARQRSLEWVINNPIRNNSNRKSWNIRNQDKIKEYQKKYKDNNRDLIRDRDKENKRIKRENKDYLARQKEIQKKWYNKKILIDLEYNKKKYLVYREKNLNYRREQRRRNPELNRKNVREWRNRNPDKVIEYCRKNRKKINSNWTHNYFKRRLDRAFCDTFTLTLGGAERIKKIAAKKVSPKKKLLLGKLCDALGKVVLTKANKAAA